MTKQGEINYFRNIGEEGMRHAVDKPFSDDECGGLLMELGAIMTLLPPPPARLLDLGCGTGWTSWFFARRGYEVTGLDISEDGIRFANERRDSDQIGNLRFVVADYEEGIFEDEFDCVVFFDALHHAVDETAAIRMAYRALKPGGICLTSEPGKGHATRPQSVMASTRFGVTEKDMPPGKVIELGRKAGFGQFKVYPRSLHLNAAIYRDSARARRLGFLRGLFRFDFVRTLVAVAVIGVYKRCDGVVLMVK